MSLQDFQISGSLTVSVSLLKQEELPQAVCGYGLATAWISTVLPLKKQVGTPWQAPTRQATRGL